MVWDPLAPQTDKSADREQPKAILLAIDLGLACGFAAFDSDGGLIAYRSSRFPTTATMRRTAWKLLAAWPHLTNVVVEGDAALGDIWRKVAAKRGIAFEVVAPETWRVGLLKPTERRNTVTAKAAARRIAKTIIDESDAPAPKGRMKHDVCEAILIGVWASEKGRPVGESPVVARS